MFQTKKILEVGAGSWVISKAICGAPIPKKINIINMNHEGPKRDTKKFLALTNLNFS